MAARKTKLNNFQSRKELYKWSDRDNSLHHTYRNASGRDHPDLTLLQYRRLYSKFKRP